MPRIDDESDALFPVMAAWRRALAPRVGCCCCCSSTALRPAAATMYPRLGNLALLACQEVMMTTIHCHASLAQQLLVPLWDAAVLLQLLSPAAAMTEFRPSKTFQEHRCMQQYPQWCPDACYILCTSQCSGWTSDHAAFRCRNLDVGGHVWREALPSIAYACVPHSAGHQSQQMILRRPCSDRYARRPTRIPHHWGL